LGVSVVEPPTSEPVSLDLAKDQCRETGDAQDGLIATYIMAARKFAEGFTRRTFATQTLDCTFDVCTGWPGRVTEGRYWRSRIELPVSPVQSVVSVKYLDVDGVERVLAADQYIVKLDETVPYIEPGYNIVWPALRSQSSGITVRVIAGWPEDDFPEDLRLAVLYLVAHYFDNRLPVVSSGMVEVPLAVEAILSGYRISRILS